MTLKISIIAFIIGFGAAWYLKGVNIPKVESKTTSQNNIVTVTKSHKTPSGDVTTVTTVTDKSKGNSTIEKQAIVAKPQYKLNALIGYNFDKAKPSYGLSLDKQFIGPIRLGVFGNTDRVYGVTLGFDF